MGRLIYTDEQIINAVKESYSISEVLTKIKASKTSGALHNLISKRIKKLNLNTKHFKNGGNITSENRKLKADEILVYNRRKGIREKTINLRRSLIEKGIQEKCICGTEKYWNGKPIVLEIHHRNNDPLDNRIENLIFLCPNCHSQESAEK